MPEEIMLGQGSAEPMARGKISLARGIRCFFFPLPVSLYVYKYTYRDCVETVYKLSLLPNDTGAETFLHEPGAMRSVDWTLITGAPAWR